MVDDAIMIHHILAIHKNPFLYGTGTVHPIADDDDNILSLDPGLFDDLKEWEQYTVLPLVGGGTGDIGDGNTYGYFCIRFALRVNDF